jgi:pilus assembly protein CpaB
MIAAIVIAAIGAGMIFLYVRGINDRAQADQEPREVLAATQQIEAGESIDDAVAAGKLDLQTYAEKDILDGAVQNTETLSGQVALQTIYPNEQIIPSKFGAPGTEQNLTIPDGTMAVSIQLTDPARVAGFINPGAKVAVFASGSMPAKSNDPNADPSAASTDTFTRLLIPSVQVIGVGTTSVLSTTTTDETGAATTEQLPKTLLTLALTQDQAEQVIFASGNGQLALGLLNDKSKVRSSPPVTFATLFQG